MSREMFRSACFLLPMALYRAFPLYMFIAPNSWIGEFMQRIMLQSPELWLVMFAAPGSVLMVVGFMIVEKIDLMIYGPAPLEDEEDPAEKIAEVFS